MKNAVTPDRSGNKNRVVIMDEPPKMIETPSSVRHNSSSIITEVCETEVSLSSVLSMDATLLTSTSSDTTGTESSFSFFSSNRKNATPSLVPRTRWSTTVWNYLLAVAALLDFLASWLHQVQTDSSDDATKETPQQQPQWYFQIPDAAWSLAKSHISVSLVFSCLWFVDAFVTARQNYQHTVRDLDRQRLLESEQADPDAPSKSKDDTTTSSAGGLFGWSKPTRAYVHTVLVQMLLLPVGFYVFLYQTGVSVWTGEGLTQHLDWSLNSKQVEVPYQHQYAQPSTNVTEEETEEQTYVHLSLLFAILQWCMTHTGRILKREGERRGKKVAVHVARQALRHPISFSRRLNKFLSYLRWIKYLAPIVATSNKFLQNFIDLLKKMRQKREAYFARKLRQALMKQRTPQEIRDHAILTMQKVYRARKARRMARAIQIFQGNQETLAALKLQGRFRALLERARERLAQKRRELAELQQLQQQKAVHAQALDDHDRARMYKLQMELQKQTDYVINKMLLRPNTRFVVWWKAAFVFAVLFEIGGKVMEPKMQKRYKSYNHMVERHVVPSRWATLPVCHSVPVPPHQKVLAFLSQRRGLAQTPRQRSRQQQQSQASTPPKRAPKQNNTDSSSSPWYCSRPATSAQGAFVTSMEFTIRHFDLFLALVFFFDVFISFFTGDLDEETGILKPQGLFPRYILPGVLLQCLVNPQMETTARILKWCLSEVVLLGPVRVTRWIVALIVPLILCIHGTFQAVRQRIAERRRHGVI